MQLVEVLRVAFFMLIFRKGEYLSETFEPYRKERLGDPTISQSWVKW